MKFSWDEGSENAPIREMFYGKEFGEKLEKFAESYRKAEGKINAKYDNLVDELHKQKHEEIARLKKDYKKRLKVSIATSEPSE